jgi:hypothetical protein
MILSLLSAKRWRDSACQEVVARIVKKHRMVNVTLHWIPGHVGVEGNEKADGLAKAATRKESDEPPQRDGVPWYLTRLALKRAKVIDGPPPPKWAETGKFTRKIDAAFHLGKSAEIYRQLNSIEAGILTQLRTGKTFLNEYLHKIKASDTAACDCGCTESIAHFLCVQAMEAAASKAATAAWTSVRRAIVHTGRVLEQARGRREHRRTDQALEGRHGSS